MSVIAIFFYNIFFTYCSIRWAYVIATVISALAIFTPDTYICQQPGVLYSTKQLVTSASVAWQAYSLAICMCS